MQTLFDNFCLGVFYFAVAFVLFMGIGGVYHQLKEVLAKLTNKTAGE